MRTDNDQIVLVVCLVALLALVLTFLNLWFLFGIVTWLLMALILAIGFGRAARQKPILHILLGLSLVYSLLLTGMSWTDSPVGNISLLFGVPVATAFLVYGIWPLGLVAAVLYFLVFHRSVLPDQKLEKFFADFCDRRQGS